MPTFDIEAARKDGLGDDQILQYLGKAKGFDVDSALKAGADKNSLMQYLSVNDNPRNPPQDMPPTPVRPAPSGVTGTWEEEPSRLRQIGNVAIDAGAAIVNPLIRNVAKDVGASISNPEVGGSILKAIPNVPGSGLNYLKNIATAVKPAKESYYVPGGEVVRGVANLATGAVQQLIPGEQGKEKYASAIGQFYKNRYGGGENIKQTFINDPVGFGADVSSLLSLGGTGVSKAASLMPKTSVVSKTNIPITSATQTLQRIGSEMSQIGNTIEPINIGIQLTKPLIKVAGSLASQIHGRFMTGAGAEATKQAFSADPNFVKALRGAINEQDVIDKAKSSLASLKHAEVDAYGTQFDKLVSTGKGKLLNIEPVKETIVKQMHDLLNIKFEIRKDIATGELVRNINYANTPLPEHQLNNVKKIADIVNKWDDYSVKGVDYLKRKIDNFYIGSADSRQYDKFINAIRNSVKTELVKQVPGYNKMTSRYSKFLNLEEELQKALSLGNRPAMDTTLKKLMSTMRENFEYRKNLLQILDNTSGNELLPQIAGLTMQSYTPKGLIGKLEIGGLGVLLYLKNLDPVLGTSLLMSSPRISGEFLYLLGKTANSINKVGQNKIVSSPALRQGLYQGGRIANITRENIDQ